MAELKGAINKTGSAGNLMKSLPSLPSKKGYNDFVIGRTIGTGSFGRVHMVKDKVTNQYYAMKALIKSEVIQNSQVEHTINEKKILSLIDHPFVVKLVTTFQDSKHLFFVLEYIQGGELFTYLRKCGVRLRVSYHSHFLTTLLVFMQLKYVLPLNTCIQKILYIEI